MKKLRKKTEKPQQRKSNTKVEKTEKTFIKEKNPCKKKIAGHKRKITMVYKTDFVKTKYLTATEKNSQGNRKYKKYNIILQLDSNRKAMLVH